MSSAAVFKNYKTHFHRFVISGLTLSSLGVSQTTFASNLVLKNGELVNHIVINYIMNEQYCKGKLYARWRTNQPAGYVYFQASNPQSAGGHVLLVNKHSAVKEGPLKMNLWRGAISDRILIQEGRVATTVDSFPVYLPWNSGSTINPIHFETYSLESQGSLLLDEGTLKIKVSYALEPIEVNRIDEAGCPRS